MGLVDNLTTAVEVIQKSDNIDLIKQMLAIQKDALELFEENKQLKEKIEGLEKALNISQNLIFRNNAYWIIIENKIEDGPFCSGCWDSDKKQIRLHFCPNPAYTNCPACKTQVKIDPDYSDIAPQRSIISRGYDLDDF